MHVGLLKASGAILAICVLALAGCGGGSPETSTIDLRSPAVLADGTIRASTSCGAGSLWLPLKWGAVPSGTKELAIYMGRFKYKKVDGARKLIVPFADLVSQIDPSQHGLAANTIPSGAAWSDFGQLSCPPARKGQNVLQEVLAFDRARPNRQLDPLLAARLTKEALEAGVADTSPRSPGALTDEATGIGRIIATYGP
jgi:hypothetical protein